MDGEAASAAAGTDRVVERARAKVNLALHVVGRRADGYHLLDMLIAFPGVADGLTAERSDGFSLSLTGPLAGALAAEPAEGNLVLRAARAYAAAFAAETTIRGVRFTLEKHLPVAAGLGGGSADGAAALRALCRLDGRDPLGPAVMALAASLGADVPMCLAERPLRARGIGETLDPLARGLPPLGMVLVNPGVAVATPAVFRALTRKDNPPLPALPDGLTADGLLSLLAATRNDLETPAIAIAPAIADVLAVLRDDVGVRFARMSGSGATCFALADDADAASAIAVRLSRRCPHWWVAASAIG